MRGNSRVFFPGWFVGLFGVPDSWMPWKLEKLGLLWSLTEWEHVWMKPRNDLPKVWLVQLARSKHMGKNNVLSCIIHQNDECIHPTFSTIYPHGGFIDQLLFLLDLCAWTWVIGSKQHCGPPQRTLQAQWSLRHGGHTLNYPGTWGCPKPCHESLILQTKKLVKRFSPK